MRNGIFRKLIALILINVLLINSISPVFSVAYANEEDLVISPTATQDITPISEQIQPETTISPTPTIDQALPTETVTPTPDQIIITPTPEDSATASATPTPANDSSPPSNGTSSDNNPDSSENNSSENTAEPTETPIVSETPMITPTPEPLTGNEELSFVIIENVSAPAIDLPATVAEGSAVLKTNKEDYAPTDTALIMGSKLLSNTDYLLAISSDNEPKVGVNVQIKTDDKGEFAYAYQLDGTYRPNYKAELKDLAGTVVASTTFTDSLTPPTLPNNPSDNYALASVTGIWTQTNGGSNIIGLNTNEVRWGDSAGYGQSGLRFDGSGEQSFDENQTFYLGMLTHLNWPIYNAATGAKLKITLTFSKPGIAPNPEFSYDFNIEETPNTAGNCPSFQKTLTPCDDKITFPNSYGTQTFTINDKIYTLKIDGFVDNFPGGSPVSEFITEERKDNSAFLVGHLSSILVEKPEITITKKTNNEIAQTAPGPNINSGDPVTWDYIVQNTGKVILNNILVNDDKIGTIACPQTSLDPGTNMTCTATGTAIAGQYENTATATGITPTQATITDTDISHYYGLAKGHLIVHKTTIPANDPTVFTITAGGSGTIVNGGSGTVTDAEDQNYEMTQGTYSIEEAVPAGWSKTGDTCQNVVVGAGATVTCTLTNTKDARLTVNKVVINDNGGTKQIADFPLFVDATSVISGATNTFDSGPHTVSETNQTDYSKSFSGDCDSNGNVTLIPGATKTCTITNDDKAGHLIVNKITDPASDITTEFGITVSGTGNIVNPEQNITGGSSIDFTVDAGTYSATEAARMGWDITSNPCQNIEIANGETKECTITNTQRSSISGYKWNDLNANTKKDCAFTPLDQIISGSSNLCEGGFSEPTLSGWHIQLFQNNGGFKGDQIGDDAVTDLDGNYSFPSIVPGDYFVCEVQQPGWEQTYPNFDSLYPNCHQIALGANEDLTDRNFGNQNLIPALTISKANDAVGNKAPGDTVKFTIVISNDQNAGPADNVRMTDLLPKGFIFNSSSWKVLSSNSARGVTGDISSLLAAPTYASPGTWNLGRIETGETLTLSYTATIDGGQQAGTYYDNAWAQGTPVNDASNIMLASAVIPGKLDSTFVGTQVSVAKGSEGGPEYKTTATQEVLGASIYLPATGENTLWVTIATLMFTLGAGTLVTGFKLKKKYE